MKRSLNSLTRGGIDSLNNSQTESVGLTFYPPRWNVKVEVLAEKRERDEAIRVVLRMLRVRVKMVARWLFVS